jgi:hypothetical protein
MRRMSLRGPSTPPKTRQVTFKLSEEICGFLKQHAAQEKRTQAEVVELALYLEWDLAEHLEPVREQLQAYAAQHGYNLSEDLGEMISRLVLERFGEKTLPSPAEEASARPGEGEVH